MAATDLTGLDGGSVSVAPDRIDALTDRVQGRVIRRGEHGWDEAVEIWNGMVAQQPALAVRPRLAADVAAVVDFVRTEGVLSSIKGGGHNIAGTSMTDGGLLMDMSGMKDVVVDAEGGFVDVGPGCLLGDVDAVTQQHGLATVLGFVSQTGVAGLALGGGFGYLTRRWGWTVDNLVEVDIVTADGRMLTASRDQHPELFWALRGGGGNFGVVTRFRFTLHEVGPMITGGLIAWGAERATDVIEAYHEMTSGAPRELTAALTIRRAPPAPFLPAEWHGERIVGVVLCHSGDDPETDLAPLRAVGEPIGDAITEKPYAAQQAMLDGNEPKGPHRYWKTEFLPGLTEGFLDTFREAAVQVESPMSQSVIFHLEGALGEHDDDDGAVGNRDAAFVSGFAGAWQPDVDGSGEVEWARRSWEQIRRYSTGGNYVNFQVADDDAARLEAAYAGNLGRLQAVKAEYDPDNLFRTNRNISPAG